MFKIETDTGVHSLRSMITRNAVTAKVKCPSNHERAATMTDGDHAIQMKILEYEQRMKRA